MAVSVAYNSELFASLNAQISDHVQNLKARAQKTAYTAPQPRTDNRAETEAGRFSYGSYAVTYLGPDAVYSLHNQAPSASAGAGRKYADKAYAYADRLNAEPSVLIDFYHKNNRSFDFRI